MTLAVVHENNTHAMTLVDPYVVCLEEQTCKHTRWIHMLFMEKNRHAVTLAVIHEKNRHAMTLVDPYVVHEKNRHAITLVDPYVVCLEEHTCNDTSYGS